MKLLASLLASCLTLSAFGWGSEGHETTGAIADQLIKGSEAEKQVRALLGDESLSTASLWADQVKGYGEQTPEMDQFKKANPAHAQSHYTDIPFQEKRYRDD